MPISPFHAMYKARILSNYVWGRDKLMPVFASSRLSVFPYQVAASMFALRSPYIKGCILGDEGSLGKTYEAMLIVSQKWYEGKQHILIVLPTHLLFQWIKKVEECFSVPYLVIDSEAAFHKLKGENQGNPFSIPGIVLTTYEFAAIKHEALSEVAWDTAVFDEADRLNTCYEETSKVANLLKQATSDAYKVLLTPTPIKKKITDIYGLIYFIDETALPDIDTYYQRYFRKPENYPELSERVSRFCFRTLRSQVTGYAKIPDRLPITATYEYSNKETQLYQLLEKYIARPQKAAFPQMEKYDLALMLCGRMSSSVKALYKTLYGTLKRLKAESDEYQQIKQMLELAASIDKTAKDKELMLGLETAFARLKKIGGNQKALIFTENVESQKHLYQLLNKGKYAGSILTFNGSKSRDYAVWERFSKDIKIVITTDVAAKGLDIPFCSLVVNYDLPYDTMKIDQRINRCQRQDQPCEVIVLNFINKSNFYDVRIMELINKRLLQFKGVFGMSDDLLGLIDVNLQQGLTEILSAAKTKSELQAEFENTLVEKEDDNKALVGNSMDSLFTTFTKEIAENVTITPQYIEDKTKEINNMLWEVTEYFFDGTGIKTDSETRTIFTGALYGMAPKVFTGAKIGRNEYSMAPDYKPRSGRYTLTCPLAKNMVGEIFWKGIPDKGTVVVNGACERCTVGFYCVKVKAKTDFMGGYQHYAFVGKTLSGRILSDKECRDIMDIPVVSFTSTGEKYGESDGLSKQKEHEDLDDMLDTQFYIEQTANETNEIVKEQISKLKTETSDKKAGLERHLSALRGEIKSVIRQHENEQNRLLKLQLEKKLNSLQKQQKQSEQTLFMDGLRLDLECEQKTKDLIDSMQFTAEIKRQFIINVEGI